MRIGDPVYVPVSEKVIAMVSHLLLELDQVFAVISAASDPCALCERKHCYRHSVCRENLLRRFLSDIVPKAKDASQGIFVGLVHLAHLAQEIIPDIAYQIAMVEISHV